MVIARCFTPFYLTLISWFPPDEMQLELHLDTRRMLQLRELRGGNNAQLYSFVAQRGTNAVLENVNEIKKDFQGGRLSILPTYEAFARWEVWRRYMAVPLMYKRGNWEIQRAYFGFMLGSFARMHNFKFDTIRYEEGLGNCHLGLVGMQHGVLCDEGCDGSRLVLNTLT